ncbi:NAD(P)H-dependent oxidoreductase [Scardovia inopinata]|uniref:NAD(P)H-dependent oxidoreductase n=1 Tax=Scardovia inopinata TaxID=78259 RepID=UPI0005FCC022|nr:NAD(P)H-dependent oxidoreductase [Scardovia inopinata]BAR07345.1 NAD(P)H dehydrogenase [Scardovia inopinata JCM 12537]
MKVALIYAYPNDKGYNHAVYDAVNRGLHANANVDEISVIDLYRDHFNPVLFSMRRIEEEI